jgi:hypothetical protein
MARTITVVLSPRERAALAIWFLDVVTPKTRQERRSMNAALDELGLDKDMDQMANQMQRPALRSISTDDSGAERLSLKEATIRYVIAEIDPEKRPGVTGHIHSVLGTLDDRLSDLLKSPPQDP